MQAYDGHVCAQIALPLHGKPHGAIAAHGDMADGVFVQIRGQFHLLLYLARQAQIAEVGAHKGDVELGAASIRVGLDAAIGDHQTGGVAAQEHLMRADAAGGKLADAAIVAGVPDANHAFAALEGILGRIHHLALGGEHAVTVEVMPLRWLQPRQLRARAAVDDIGKSTGTAGKGHRFGPCGVGAGGMAPIRQGMAEQHLARLREPRDHKQSQFVLARREIGGRARVGPGGGRGHAAGHQACNEAASRGHL